MLGLGVALEVSNMRVRTLFGIVGVPFNCILGFVSSVYNNGFSTTMFVFALLMGLTFVPLAIGDRGSTIRRLHVGPGLSTLGMRYNSSGRGCAVTVRRLCRGRNISVTNNYLPVVFHLVVVVDVC